MSQVHDAFTFKLRNITEGVTTNVGISQPFDVDSIRQAPKPYITSALWDTGSSHCSITKSLADSLNLHPIHKTAVSHHEGITFANMYLMTLFITQRYYIVVELIETKAPSSNFELIIGMDIILKGDFALTNENDICTFSFKLPSSETIDFTKKSDTN